MSLNIPNLDKLIAHMQTLRPDQFDMKDVFRDERGRYGVVIPDMSLCGTAACIAGECAVVSNAPKGERWGAESAAEWLGIEDCLVASDLFTPKSYYFLPEQFPLPRAINVLCHLRDAGEVRWDLFPSENYSGKPWSAPRAVEITPPPLPETITRFLAAEPVTTGSEER